MLIQAARTVAGGVHWTIATGSAAMRLLIDTLIALMLVGILAGIVVYHQRESRQLQRYQQVHAALAQLHEKALYQGALGDEPTTQTGFPATVSPLWFHGDLPLNVLVPGRHAWVDIAPPGDMSEHPPDPVCIKPQQAGFWYNPNRGIFRARVPEQHSESLTLAEYNRINTTYLKQLPLHYDSARRPVALQLASMTQATTSGVGDVAAVREDGRPARPLQLTRPAADQP
jgi:type II secretory pathway pseudopilin PulG